MYDPQKAISYVEFKSQKCTFFFVCQEQAFFSFFGGTMQREKLSNNVIVYKMKWAENNITKQNKELPSIPLCTYYNLPYPVTQRLALYSFTSTLFNLLISISIYIFNMCAHNTNLYVHKKKVPYSLSRATLMKYSKQEPFSECSQAAQRVT